MGLWVGFAYIYPQSDPTLGEGAVLYLVFCRSILLTSIPLCFLTSIPPYLHTSILPFLHKILVSLVKIHSNVISNDVILKI